METLQKTLEKMPDEFNSNEFCNQAKKFGFSQLKINQGLIAEFLHKNCKQGITKRRWKKKTQNFKNEIKMTKPKHYDNSNGSLYQFAQQQKLNAYEFDIIKRIVRCRKKGAFKEDLEKTKLVIDLYLKEYQQDRTPEYGC